MEWQLFYKAPHPLFLNMGANVKIFMLLAALIRSFGFNCQIKHESVAIWLGLTNQPDIYILDIREDLNHIMM